MKQITLSIPEDKYPFFIELLNSIDFVSIENFPPIPEEHKKLVVDRKKSATSETMKNWDDIKSQFKVNE
jgi:hypothetical protein